MASRECAFASKCVVVLLFPRYNVTQRTFMSILYTNRRLVMWNYGKSQTGTFTVFVKPAFTQSENLSEHWKHLCSLHAAAAVSTVTEVDFRNLYINMKNNLLLKQQRGIISLFQLLKLNRASEKNDSWKDDNYLNRLNESDCDSADNDIGLFDF